MTTQQNKTEVDIAIDALVGAWSGWENFEDFYLNELIPAIILEHPHNQILTPNENELVSRLKRTLTNEQWLNLSEIVRERIREKQNFIF